MQGRLPWARPEAGAGTVIAAEVAVVEAAAATTGRRGATKEGGAGTAKAAAAAGVGAGASQRGAGISRRAACARVFAWIYMLQMQWTCGSRKARMLASAQGRREL